MRLTKLPPGLALDPIHEEWLQGEIEPGSKRSRVVEHTFGSTADTEERIRHNLGARPTGFRVVDQDGAGTVYRDTATTKANRRFIWLKSSVASRKVSIEVF